MSEFVKIIVFPFACVAIVWALLTTSLLPALVILLAAASVYLLLGNE